MEKKTAIFEATRPLLMGIAYRLLGSVSDAQDVVQDTYIKWLAHRESVQTPAAWLSRVCTNRCLDQIKSASHKRVEYVGQWIPDQLLTEFAGSVDEQEEMASSLTTAFLLLLKRLTPKERAAYLLHDVFSMSFDDVAGVLDIQPANCRKLATRAREYVGKNNVRHIPERQRQEELLTAFQGALQSGCTSELETLLRADSDLRADSGGKVTAVLDVIEGKEAICLFLRDVLHNAWLHFDFSSRVINGTLGLLVEDEGELHASVSFGFDGQGQLSQIYIQRNPEKLKQLMQSKGTVNQSGRLSLH